MRQALTARRPSAVALVCALSAVTIAIPAGMPERAAAASSTSGPYLTLLFSRTNVTAATAAEATNGCIETDDNIARLDTVVAPALYALGLHPTGTIETGRTHDFALWCGHYNLSYLASWDLARSLVVRYGWSFASHSATYPNEADEWIALGISGPYDETCGTAQQLSSEGLPGATGLVAWPGN